MDQFSLWVAGTFIFFIFLETVLSVWLELDNYVSRDSIANFSIAAVNAVLNLAFKGMALALYQSLEKYAPVHLGPCWWVWILLLLLTDLFYYLFHVLGHKSRFFWASHVVHHSSEKFNLTTALRSGVTNTPFRFAFSAPLVLMGFDPFSVILMDSLVLIYTFFIHTELVGKLGQLEKVLNTPSHHRVHHGCDRQYLDKNFGAVFILWDKLFGTYQEEIHKPAYGLTKPISTYNPVKIALQEWSSLIADLCRPSTWEEKWMYAFGKPGWKPLGKPVHYSLKTFSMMARVLAMLVISLGFVQAQSTEEILKHAKQFEAAWQDQAALERYEAVLKKEPTNQEALVRSSRMLCNIGGRSKDKDFKKTQALRAKQIAQKAIRINQFNKEARLCYILSLGIMAEMADSPREKLSNAKIIKSEAEYILKLDSNFAPAYYILGKWHFAVASLSRIEVMVCNLLFGGVPPGASIDEAVRCFNKAIDLWPDYIVFHYGMAMALHHAGDDAKTVFILEKALQLSPRDPDDYGRQQKCKRLLQQIRQNL